MNKCRVVENKSGGVSVITPAFKSKKPNETESEFLDRVYEKAMNGSPDLKDQDYFDTTKDKLPDRDKRNKWAMKPDKKGLIIDEVL